MGEGGEGRTSNEADSVAVTYFVLQPLRLLLRFECHEAVALADARPVDDDLGGLDVAVRGKHATQFRFGCVATVFVLFCLKNRRTVNTQLYLHFCGTTYLIPPTNMRFGISVPYLGTDSGASS